MAVTFKTAAADFPPNVEQVKIQQLLLYFVHRDRQTDQAPYTTPISVTLAFKEAGSQREVKGTATLAADGVLSTLRGNAGSWNAMVGRSPVGEWTLALPNRGPGQGLVQRGEDRGHPVRDHLRRPNSALACVVHSR